MTARAIWKLAKSIFRSFFFQKQGRMLLDLHFEIIFEILSSFAAYVNHFR